MMLEVLKYDCAYKIETNIAIGLKGKYNIAWEGKLKPQSQCRKIFLQRYKCKKQNGIRLKFIF